MTQPKSAPDGFGAKYTVAIELEIRNPEVLWEYALAWIQHHNRHHSKADQLKRHKVVGSRAACGLNTDLVLNTILSMPPKELFPGTRITSARLQPEAVNQSQALLDRVERAEADAKFLRSINENLIARPLQRLTDEQANDMFKAAALRKQLSAAISQRDGLAEAVRELAEATKRYRLAHDLHGHGDIRTGRCWDAVRRSEQAALSKLNSSKEAK